MLTVNRETIASIHELIMSKLGSTEKASSFLKTAHPGLKGRRPGDVVRGRDHFELMKLSAVVASMDRLAARERDVSEPSLSGSG